MSERARLSTSPLARALESGGGSTDTIIHEIVGESLAGLPERPRLLADVGCGAGALHPYVKGSVDRYLGIDIARYPGYPAEAPFIQADLDGPSPLREAVRGSEAPDVLCCLETVEHVESPRALFRALAGWLAPGGTLVLSTPNQLSLLSKMCLVLKNEFVHFQERPGLYPAHLSALLEVDLLRMARENGLVDPRIVFTGKGRMPLTSRCWPRLLQSRRGGLGRALSDNVILFARKERTGAGPPV